MVGRGCQTRRASFFFGRRVRRVSAKLPSEDGRPRPTEDHYSRNSRLTNAERQNHKGRIGKLVLHGTTQSILRPLCERQAFPKYSLAEPAEIAENSRIQQVCVKGKALSSKSTPRLRSQPARHSPTLAPFVCLSGSCRGWLIHPKITVSPALRFSVSSSCTSRRPVSGETGSASKTGTRPHIPPRQYRR